MSSFLYPDGWTRGLINDNLDRSVKHYRKVKLGSRSAPLHSAEYYKNKKQEHQKQESMIARAQRLSEEKGLLKKVNTTPIVKNTFTKMVSKLKNFISRLWQ